MEKKINYQIGEEVWVKQADMYDCWTKGVVVGFTPKRIKIKDITRDYYKNENKIGNIKPSNVKKIDWVAQ